MTIGVVCQGGSFRSGYGPGVVVIMTSKDDLIQPIVSSGSNIKQLLE